MIHTSIASSLQAPIKTKQIDIKCSPALGLHLLAKSAVQHSSQVLSTDYLTLVLAYNLLQLRPKFVKCSNCSFDMTYGEYVEYIAYKDSRYRDILSDYK